MEHSEEQKLNSDEIGFRRIGGEVQQIRLTGFRESLENRCLPTL